MYHLVSMQTHTQIYMYIRMTRLQKNAKQPPIQQWCRYCNAKNLGWQFGFRGSFHSWRLETNSSSGVKTIVPIRPIAVVKGVLDLVDSHMRIF